MKLSDIIKIWDILHVKDIGDLGYCDLEKAIDEVAGIENDIPGCQPTVVWRLDVYYDLYQEDKSVHRDDEIKKIAGVEINGSGIMLSTGVRDCELHFETEEKRKAATSALREVGFRFTA